MVETKMKLGDAVAAESVLQRLSMLMWPPKLTYTIGKLYTLVRAETKIWHENREKWGAELGTKKEMGWAIPQTIKENGHSKPNPAIGEFVKRLQELGEVEIVITWAPLDFSALSLAEEPPELGPDNRLLPGSSRRPAKFSPQEILSLGPLLGEPED